MAIPSKGRMAEDTIKLLQVRMRNPCYVNCSQACTCWKHGMLLAGVPAVSLQAKSPTVHCSDLPGESLPHCLALPLYCDEALHACEAA